VPLGLGRTLHIFPGDVIQRAILAERQVYRVRAILLVSASFENHYRNAVRFIELCYGRISPRPFVDQPLEPAAS